MSPFYLACKKWGWNFSMFIRVKFLLEHTFLNAAKLDIIVSGTRRDEFDDFEMPIWFSTSTSANANTFS